jgi:hypothetical protein
VTDNSHSLLDEFENALIELIDLLEEFNVENWKKWFEEALKTFRNNSAKGAKKALDAYGGMGSFNDFALPYNQPITPNDFSLSKKRIKFNDLHETIYELANEILKSK